MRISLRESQVLDKLAEVLYDMLPGSGNPRHSFPTAAHEVGLPSFWIGGSKRPAIVALLSSVYEQERHRFCDLIEAIVRHSVSWRAGKSNPLTREEVDAINDLLLSLEFRIRDLNDPGFLSGLERRTIQKDGQAVPEPARLHHRSPLNIGGFCYDRPAGPCVRGHVGGVAACVVPLALCSGRDGRFRTDSSFGRHARLSARRRL